MVSPLKAERSPEPDADPKLKLGENESGEVLELVLPSVMKQTHFVETNAVFDIYIPKDPKAGR